MSSVGWIISNVSVAPSVNIPYSSIHFTILIISFISSFEMNKINSFSALTTPFRYIFLSNLSNTDEVALVSNLGKISLAQGTRSYNVFLPKLPNVLPENPSDWMNLDNYALLSFISANMPLAKAVLILVFLSCC